jgi:2-amino-4-hydroxy-6-hydroxymethyldihydropteridine diphosphokinase
MKKAAENKKVKVYLGLGSNIGSRLSNIRFALAAIGQVPGVSILRLSPIYESEPYGNQDQPGFLNAVLEVETSLDHCDLLKALQRVERHMGRVRKQKWDPRVIDLDILYYGSLVIEDPELAVPHPDLHNRDFVLVPLNDLIPRFTDPLRQATVQGLMKKLGKSGRKIKKLETANF